MRGGGQRSRLFQVVNPELDRAPTRTETGPWTSASVVNHRQSADARRGTGS